MQEIDINRIKPFLLAHDYIVQVKQSDTDECIVTFPHPKITKRSSTRDIVKYAVKRDSLKGVFINDDFWSVPEYAIRLTIYCDILNRMRKIPIHESLIIYYKDDSKEVEGLQDIISEPKDENERKKEGFLSELLWKSVEDKFPAAYEEVAYSPEHSVGKGYRILKSFF